MDNFGLMNFDSIPSKIKKQAFLNALLQGGASLMQPSQGVPRSFLGDLSQALAGISGDYTKSLMGYNENQRDIAKEQSEMDYRKSLADYQRQLVEQSKAKMSQDQSLRDALNKIVGYTQGETIPSQRVGGTGQLTNTGFNIQEFAMPGKSISKAEQLGIDPALIPALSGENIASLLMKGTDEFTEGGGAIFSKRTGQIKEKLGPKPGSQNIKPYYKIDGKGNVLGNPLWLDENNPDTLKTIQAENLVPPTDPRIIGNRQSANINVRLGQVSATPFVGPDGTPYVMDKFGNMRPANVQGTAIPKPAAFTPESAAKAQLIEQAVGYMPTIRTEIFGADGKKPIDRTDIVNIGLRTPFTKGRQISTYILDAVEAKLRAESGAAVPDTEVARIAKRFIPQAADNDDTIKLKVNNLEKWLAGTQEKINQGRPNAAKGAATPSQPTSGKLGKYNYTVK